MGAYGAQADPFVKPFSPERVASSTDNAFESAAAPRQLYKENPPLHSAKLTQNGTVFAP
jgi:hypothetical protein